MINLILFIICSLAVLGFCIFSRHRVTSEKFIAPNGCRRPTEQELNFFKTNWYPAGFHYNPDHLAQERNNMAQDIVVIEGILLNENKPVFIGCTSTGSTYDIAIGNEIYEHIAFFAPADGLKPQDKVLAYFSKDPSGLYLSCAFAPVNAIV